MPAAPSGPPPVTKTPGFLASASLAIGRGIQRVADVPWDVSRATELVGRGGDQVIANSVTSFGQAYASLGPKGPAKLLLPLLQKAANATVRSDKIGEKNFQKFYLPVSRTADSIGTSVGGLFAKPMAKALGGDPSSRDVLSSLLHTSQWELPPKAQAPAQSGGDTPPPAQQSGGQGSANPPDGTGEQGGTPAPAQDAPPAQDSPPSDQSQTQSQPPAQQQAPAGQQQQAPADQQSQQSQGQ